MFWVKALCSRRLQHGFHEFNLHRHTLSSIQDLGSCRGANVAWVPSTRAMQVSAFHVTWAKAEACCLIIHADESPSLCSPRHKVPISPANEGSNAWR